MLGVGYSVCYYSRADRMSTDGISTPYTVTSSIGCLTAAAWMRHHHHHHQGAFVRQVDNVCVLLSDVLYKWLLLCRLHELMQYTALLSAQK